MVAALDKIVAKLENIFWQPKIIVRAVLKTVRATLTVVKIGRCWNPYVSNGLRIVSDNRQSDVDNLQSDADNLQGDVDHCRRASDYLLRDQENSRSHHENLLVRADHVLRNPDYCLDDSNSLHDDGDNRHGRKEDGVDRAGHDQPRAPGGGRVSLREGFHFREIARAIKCVIFN